jgi:Ca2+-binding EF-hand superfamily protein
MRIHWMRALTAAAVLGMPALALAQLAASREQTFRERDRNHDGVLTQEEYGGHPGNFRAMDANGDRVLSLNEFVNRYRDDNANDAVQIPAPPPPAPVAPDAFAVMDRNRNGRIDRDEWRADLAAASFARMDRNHDGVVMRDEFMNPMPVGSLEARFGEMDVNNNGYVNRSEWRDAVSFDVVDRNRDNRVTIDEYLDRRNGNGYGYGTGSLAARFAQLDRNHNGVINRGEWRGERLSFDAVDRNGDNRITEDEYVNMGTDGYAYEYGNGRSGDGRSGNMEMRFVQMDRNRDGVLARGEWRDSTEFRQVDRNNDGYVTLREYLNAPVVYETPYGDRYGTNRSTDFRSLDRNNSGYIERREWTSDLTEFDRMDRNGDGRLSTWEYAGATGTTQGSYETFRRLDDNGDGVLSRTEWNGSAQAFADYDRNRDGVISRDEFLNYSRYNY